MPRGFDVDLDDRVDPVRPGEQAVYELAIENSLLAVAPGVVVTDLLPPGTSFVEARRAPDWSLVPAAVFADRVELSLGDLPSCGAVDLPACRDVWVTLRVDAGVAPGTVLENRVVMSSTDPTGFPTHRSRIFTSVGSAAIRTARVLMPTTATGRDTVSVEADLARDGRSSPVAAATPTLDPTAGLRVVLREPGGAIALDVDLPGSAFRCRGTSSRRCRLADPKAWRGLGLDRLDVFLPELSSQRNGASLLVRTAKGSLPDDFGPDLLVTVESGGETWSDVATLRVGSGRLSYSHAQTDP
ncbi:MAG: DUF11 domain-containing protein [Alphaproteobacteria bacterium]